MKILNRWMIRSYSFCFTNMMIHLISFVAREWMGIDYATSYTIGVCGAISLLLVIPEMNFLAGKRRQ